MKRWKRDMGISFVTSIILFLSFISNAYSQEAAATDEPSEKPDAPPVEGKDNGTAITGTGDGENGDAPPSSDDEVGVAPAETSPDDLPPVAALPVAETVETTPVTAPVGNTASEPPSEPPPPLPMAGHGPRRMMLLIGPGYGFSFMYPKKVNDYLEDWKNAQGASVEQGTTAILLSIQPKLAIAFAPIEYVQIQVVGEVGWAPKIIAVSGGDSGVFHYMRYTTGGTVAGHIPISNGRRSLSFGAGGLFNVLKFEDIQEIAPGVRALFGFRFYTRRRFTPEIFAEFNWIRADVSDSDAGEAMDIDELNYTSFTIGGNFYFKIIEQ
jgi:hypothetical protein